MKQRYFFLLPIPFVFSCATVYQPSSVITPLLEEKGDLEAQASFRMGNMSTEFMSGPAGATVNAGVAYAITNKIATIFNYEYQNETFNDAPTWLSEIESTNGRLSEIYLGTYFSNSGFSNTSVFLGAGKGYRGLTFSNYDYSNSYKADFRSDYVKASALIQHSIREKWKREDERLVLTVFGRFNFIHNYDIYFEAESNFLENLQAYDDVWTIEPGFNISLVYGRFTIFVQEITSISPSDFSEAS